MYNAKETDAYFRGELNQFIQVAENHTKNEKTRLMHCPCNICKNLRVYSEPTTIRLHVIVSSFVKDYKIWKYLGETDAPPPMNNPLDEIMRDEEFGRKFHSYFDGGGDDDGAGDDDGVADDDGVGGFEDVKSTIPWIVIVVVMNLMMVIFSDSCCTTPKQRYWLLVLGG